MVMKRETRDKITAFPVIALIRTLQVLPTPVTLAFGRFLGGIAALIRIRRSVLDKNLRIAFPEMSDTDRSRLIGKIYRNIGLLFGEWMTLRKRGDALLDTVEYMNLECFMEAQAEGKGVLLNSAHFGNWEVMARPVRKLTPAMSIVRRRLSNTALDRLFTELHGESGVKNLIKGQSPLAIRRCLKRGEVVSMLVDQNARSPGIFVPFFGRRTSFHRGSALMALKGGIPFITVFLVPIENNRWRFEFDRIDATPTGDQEKDIARIMTEYAAKLEAMIRKYPDRWFWFHRRWKTKPPPETPQ